jgi:hypothetical protein
METAFSFFWRPYQRLTSPREKNTAENIEVRMPMQWTTAKPRTGPIRTQAALRRRSAS